MDSSHILKLIKLGTSVPTRSLRFQTFHFKTSSKREREQEEQMQMTEVLRSEDSFEMNNLYSVGSEERWRLF